MPVFPCIFLGKIQIKKLCRAYSVSRATRSSGGFSPLLQLILGLQFSGFTDCKDYGERTWSMVRYLCGPIPPHICQMDQNFVVQPSVLTKKMKNKQASVGVKSMATPYNVALLQVQDYMWWLSSFCLVKTKRYRFFIFSLDTLA